MTMAIVMVIVMEILMDVVALPPKVIGTKERWGRVSGVGASRGVGAGVRPAPVLEYCGGGIECLLRLVIVL